MKFKLLFVFLFIALLSSFATAGKKKGKKSFFKFRFRAKGALCTAKKTCDYAKLGVTSLKDFTIQLKSLASAAGGSLTHGNLMLLASYTGPIGALFGIGIGIAAFVLEKHQKDEVKAAVAILAKKMDLLALQIDDAANKVIAHSELKHFQKSISRPAYHLMKSYIDYISSSSEEDKMIFKKQCEKYVPLNIYNEMAKALELDSDNVLKSHKYTDKAFREYRKMFESVMLEMAPLYFYCEKLTNVEDKSRSQEEIEQNRMRKYDDRITIIFDRFERINASRTENMWTIMPDELQRLYTEYAQMKVEERKKKEFGNRIAYKFNEDYAQFEYSFAFGVLKNRGKTEKFYAFSCQKEVCHVLVKDDYVLWIMRSKRHCNGKKQHFDLHTSPRACLQFEAELYDLYNTDLIKMENATDVLLTFMKNCRLENAIALFRYSEKLRGDTDGIAQLFDGRNIRRKKEKGKKYTFKSKHPKYLIEEAHFKDAVFWSDCPSGESFDFMKEYCETGSEWPKCYLRESAYVFHELHENKHLPEVLVEATIDECKKLFSKKCDKNKKQN